MLRNRKPSRFAEEIRMLKSEMLNNIEIQIFKKAR